MTERQRRNPFRGFLDQINEANRARQSWMTGPETSGEPQERTHASAWVPITDVFAREGDLVIRCELAGVRREDMEISYSDGVLTISGDREGGPAEEEIEYYTRERYYGIFRRSMTLPAGVDEEDVSAHFENGMLEITVRGGAVAPEPRGIEITTVEE